MLIYPDKETKNAQINVAKIEELCAAQSLSIAELGRRIGLPHRESIHRRLDRTCTMTADELFLIADTFGLAADDLRVSRQ